MAAVLFTDLVGSTELMARLGDTAFDELRGEHFTRLREAVERYHGDEVKNTGDGVLVTFASVVDALSCSVAMQQATERHARAASTPLALRVGLAIGEVGFEDSDVFGTPVVEAARLVAAARPGQILTTTIVRMMAGSRVEACFTELGALDLKGFPDPVPACEVAWSPLPGNQGVALPVLMTGSGRVFVGREGELERLQALWKESVAGERRLALIAGEPGVGKTRLAAELGAAVHPQGAIVLAGRCDEDLGVPYQPFVEALRHYLSAPASGLRLGRHGGELVRLVPELAELRTGLQTPLQADPETERYRLFDAVAAWLAEVSAETPVLLVLDDVQWAAKPTLLLLRHVLRSPESLRLLVTVTYRDTEVGRGHPLSELLSDLRRHEGVERISLTGLDVASVTAYLEETAGHALADEDDDFARAIWSETEGNPFFVGEVLRHLRETGDVVRRDGRWVTTGPIDDLGIPEGIRDVVGRRLSRLSETTNRSLAVAAVVGMEFEPAVVARAGGFDEDPLLTALEEAAAARLVVETAGPGIRYRFAHALVRGTLYDELTAARRVALHRKVAEAVELTHADRLDDHAPALAHHWARASVAAETDRAVTWAQRAGDRALAQLAHDEAADWYRQSIDLLDTAGVAEGDRRRLLLLVNLGDAQRRAGDPAHRHTLLDAAARAQAHGEADILAQAALATHRGFFSTSGRVSTEMVAALEAALEAIETADSPVRARLLANLAEELGFSPRHERRRQLADDALAMARRLGDPVTLAHVLARRYSTLLTTTERRQEMVELVALANRLDDAVLNHWAGLWLALTDLATGRFEEFERGLALAAQRATELGQPVLRWTVGFIQSGRHRMAGRLAEAEATAVEARDVGVAAGVPDAGRISGVNLFWIRYDQGRLDELISALERPDAHPMTLAVLGLAYCELDRPEDARHVLDRLAVDRFAALPGNFAWSYILTVITETCAGVGDEDRAALLYDWLTPHQGLVMTSGGATTGAADHYLGLLASTLGRFDDADRHFQAGAALHERIGAPTMLARTRLEWGRMLAARGNAGDADRAGALLHQALATARELGLATVERRAIALLEGP